MCLWLLGSALGALLHQRGLLPLHRLYLLERSKGEDVCIERVQGHAAISLIQANTYRLGLVHRFGRNAAHLRQCAVVADRVQRSIGSAVRFVSTACRPRYNVCSRICRLTPSKTDSHDRNERPAARCDRDRDRPPRPLSLEQALDTALLGPAARVFFGTIAGRPDLPMRLARMALRFKARETTQDARLSARATRRSGRSGPVDHRTQRLL
jgi:hypothetical protein